MKSKPGFVLYRDQVYMRDTGRRIFNGLSAAQLWETINHLSDYMPEEDWQLFYAWAWDDYTLLQERSLVQVARTLAVAAFALNLLLTVAFRKASTGNAWNEYD